MRAAFAILFVALGLNLGRVEATETTFMDVGLGYPAMTVALDPRLQPDLNSKTALGFGAWRTLRGVPLGLGVATTLYLGGDFGTMSVLTSGAVLTYFFGGRPISDFQIADEVIVRSRGWSPYIKFSPGLMFMNLRSPIYTKSFGASSPMLALSAGIMIPSGLINHWQVDLSYSTSINATDDSKSPISVSGYLLSVAYSMGLP